MGIGWFRNLCILNSLKGLKKMFSVNLREVILLQWKLITLFNSCHIILLNNTILSWQRLSNLLMYLAITHVISIIILIFYIVFIDISITCLRHCSRRILVSICFSSLNLVCCNIFWIFKEQEVFRAGLFFCGWRFNSWWNPWVSTWQC